MLDCLLKIALRMVRRSSSAVRRFTLALVSAALLISCSAVTGAEPTRTPGVIPVVTVFASPAPPTATPLPTATPIPVETIAIAPDLPANLREGLAQSVRDWVASRPMPQIDLQVSDGTAGDVTIGFAQTGGTPLITRTYAVVAPFPTVADNITSTDFAALWQGDDQAISEFMIENAGPIVFVDAATREAMTQLIGEPGITVQVVTSTDLISQTWAGRPTALAVVPFDTLDARWKLLHVDGINLFEREADMAAYPFNLRVTATGDAALIGAMMSGIAAPLAAQSNRDLSKMTVVAMTGVTALVRGTAVMMEQKGITYPAQMIQGWLTTADITHISNEVSFWEDCPAPTFNDGVSMCSNPKYIELLKYVGTDVVELTGNHLWDKGVRFLSSTIQTYKDLGWGYFGGGLNVQDAMKPLTMTVNGNRIAFIGCNWFGENWATDEYAGSAPCSVNDPRDLTDISAQIGQLKSEGYLVIATLQYAEFYEYGATIQQAIDFDRLRSAGAVVVNGSQGHHAQGFDVNEQGFLHYGTGNIFFGDQSGEGTHQTFVDRHVFYDGRYLGVDLRTAYIRDNSQPQPMTPEERADLLQILFKVSGY